MTKNSFKVAVSDVELKWWEKICFALGGVPYQFTSTIIGFFISIFLLEVAMISPYHVSVITFSGKAWDALTDPLIGYFVSCTPETRFGKCKPWIILSAPLACTSYYFLWFVPDISSEIGQLFYYFFCYCSFMTFLSCLHVPYTALTMRLSDCQKERDSATAYRMLAEVSGVLLGVVLQGAIVQKFHTDGCIAQSFESTSTNSSVQPGLDVYGAYMLAAGVMCILYIACCLFVFFGVKERSTRASHTLDTDTDSAFQSLKSVVCFRPFIYLSFTFLFSSLALQTIQGNLALYVSHAVNQRAHFSTLSMTLLGSAIVTVPLWQMLISRFGKKPVYFLGISWFIPVCFSLLYLKSDVPVLYVMTMLAGVAVGALFLLPWSMLPDVIDEYMLLTGKRKETYFYAFYVFFAKIATGLTLAFSQLMLGASGYKRGKCVQSESVNLCLRLLSTPGPVTCLLLALLCLYRYPIGESRRLKIKIALQQKAYMEFSSNLEGMSSSSRLHVSSLRFVGIVVSFFTPLLLLAIFLFGFIFFSS